MKEVNSMKMYSHDQNIVTVKIVKAVKVGRFDSGLRRVDSCEFC